MNHNRLKKRILAGTMAAFVTATSVPGNTYSHTMVNAAETTNPTATPVTTATVKPTGSPSATATVKPTGSPTATATVKPTGSPAATATVKPTGSPAATATANPTETTRPSSTPVVEDIDGMEIQDGVLIKYRGDAKDVVIPDTVTEIKGSAFTFSDLVSVTIPGSVKKIGSSAFSNCKSLMTVKISSGVTSIEDYVFWGCESLTSIEIPATVEETGNSVFKDCENLKTATIKSKYIGKMQFYNCTSLTEVKLEGVQIVGEWAFSGCKSLNDIKIDGICEIEPYAFEKCEALKEIKFPSTLKKIGRRAFENCNELQKVTMGDGIDEIEEDAFQGLTKLKTVTFGEDLKKIGNRAFKNTGIESVDLKSVEVMGDWVFSECSNLKEVTLRTGVKRIGNSCFKDNENIEKVTIEPGIEVIGTYAFYGLPKIKEITLPGTLIMLDDSAFAKCGSLDQVQFPSSLKYVGKSVFYGTPWFDAKEEAAEQAKTPYIVEANVLLETIYVVSDEAFKIPERVTVIANARNDEEVFEIPEGITGIGASAFLGSNKLREVELPNSVTHIGNSAFFGMDSLEKITLPAYIQDISYLMFSNCESLKSITVPEHVKSIGFMAFSECKNLTEVNLPDGLQNLGNKVFASCPSLKELTIPASVTMIGKDIVKDCATGFVIKGYEGSTAEIYAKENNITFVSLGIIDPNQTPSPTPSTKPTETPVVTATPKVTEKPGEPTATPTGETFNVTLELNGGLAEKTSLTVVNGSTYNDLPSASKSGYIFAGWYTAIEGGTKIENTTSVNLTSDQILYAHWVELQCTLKFDANGGSTPTSEKIVFSGDVYGELPVPTKTGATFLGWYTAKEGGNLITEDMVVTLNGEITVYAQWDSNYKNVTVDSLTYNFENSNSGYGYPYDYEIPYSVYKYMFGDTLMAEELYENSGIWGGNCYGMSTTSIFFNVEEDDIDVDDFSKGKKLPSQLSLKDKDAIQQINLQRFIEAMQVSQYDSSITEAEYKVWDDLNALYEAVEASQNGKGHPVIVCIYGPTGGHAIVGYKVEGNKLYVYDPNFPKDNTRAIELEMDSDGEVWGWYYNLNDCEDWGSDYSDCAISFLTYDTFYKVWEKKAGKKYSTSNLLKLNTDNANIYDENNKQVAQIKNGMLITSDPEITQIQNREVMQNGKKREGCEIFLPAEQYTIENTGTNKSFNVEVLGTDRSMEANTTATKVTVDLDDFENDNKVYVNAKQGQTYQVTLKSEGENDKENVVIKGTASGTAGVGVSQKQGDVIFENCNSANITVDGKSVKPVEIAAKAGSNGTISREGAQNVVGGEDITYAIKADYGYMIKDVIVDGVSQGNISSYTFHNVNSKHTIEAVFETAELSKGKATVVSKELQSNGMPKVQVKIGNQILTEMDDYVVSCQSKTDKTMKLQIKGTGFYKGTLTLETEYSGSSKPGTEDPKEEVKAGQVYTVGSLKYKVTSTSKKTVSVVMKVKSTKTVTIPATVKINKTSFKVTAIGANVWKNDKTVQSVTIGKNVQTIGANAFSGAAKLKKITVKGTSLKKVGAKALKNISAKAVIKVPKTKKAAYKKLFKGKGQKKSVVVK